MLEFPFLLVNRILSKFSLSDLSKKTETIPITLNRTRNREAPFTERERERERNAPWNRSPTISYKQFLIPFYKQTIFNNHSPFQVPAILILPHPSIKSKRNQSKSQENIPNPLKHPKSFQETLNRSRNRAMKNTLQKSRASGSPSTQSSWPQPQRNQSPAQRSTSRTPPLPPFSQRSLFASLSRPSERARDKKRKG